MISCSTKAGNLILNHPEQVPVIKEQKPKNDYFETIPCSTWTISDLTTLLTESSNFIFYRWQRKQLSDRPTANGCCGWCVLWPQRWPSDLSAPVTGSPYAVAGCTCSVSDLKRHVFISIAIFSIAYFNHDD